MAARRCRGGARHGHAAGADPAAAPRRRAMRATVTSAGERTGRVIAIASIRAAAGAHGGEALSSSPPAARGHFFPAEARRRTVARAAHRADDRRALGRPAQRRCSPARERYVLRGAGIAGRGAVRASGKAVLALAAGYGAGAAHPGAARCRRGGRLRRLSACRAGAGDALDAPSPGGDPARAERGAGAGQPVPGAPRRRAGA